MGKGAVHAELHLPPVCIDILMFARAVLHRVQRTITEQAVKVLKPFMTGEIFAVTVLKKAV